MASITYSGDFGGISAGSNGKSILVSGSALPSNATIDSISYTLNITANKYSSSQNWKLLWFAIGDSDGSPYASEKSASMSSTSYTFSGSMKFSQSDVSKFTTGSFYLYAKANTTHTSATSYMRAFTITINYSTASLSTPGTPTITQNNDGTFTASWSAATGSGGSGDVTYRLYSVSDGAYVNSASTSRTYTGTIAQYNYNCQYRVYAYYGTLSTMSGTGSKTFYPPSLSTPTLTGTPSTGTELKLTWTAATLSYTTGTIRYAVYVGNTIYQDGLSGTSLTIPASTFASLGGTKDYTFYVVATASSLSNTSQGSTLKKQTSNFTYAYVKPQTDNTIAYYDGSKWVNCIVYYYDGSSWVQCEPYYYNGSSWSACSTT